MMADDTRELLQTFSTSRSEEAFRSLVRKHTPLVYTTALRRLGGDQAAAEDVSQEVFTLLARKAGRLGGVILSAWLYRQACRRAINHIRSEQRRRLREEIAIQTMAGSVDVTASRQLIREIDAALLRLPAADRDAIVLRFFENHDYSAIGGTLGISEEAARKRIRRALDRLETILKHKGIATSAAALGSSMTGFAATPAPAGLVSKITAHSFKASPSLLSGSLLTLLKPALAGITAVSLAAGSTLAIQQNSTTAKASLPSPPPPRRIATAPGISPRPRRIPRSPPSSRRSSASTPAPATPSPPPFQRRD